MSHKTTKTTKEEAAYQATMEILQVLIKHDLPYSEVKKVFEIILFDLPQDVLVKKIFKDKLPSYDSKTYDKNYAKDVKGE